MAKKSPTLNVGTTAKVPAIDMMEAVKASLQMAKDMGLLGGGCDCMAPAKPLTPKQAAAAEKKAKKDHEKWNAARKKQELNDRRFKLFTKVYPQVRIAAFERSKAAVIGLKLLVTLPDLDRSKAFRVEGEKALRGLMFDQSACVTTAWHIVDEMMIHEPPHAEYATYGGILSGCGH